MRTQNTDGLTLAQLRRFAESVRSTADRTAVLAARWVHSFFLYTAMLDDPAAEVSIEEMGMFWIRLHGVLAELPEHLAGSYFAGTTEAQARASPDPKVVQYAAAHARAAAAVGSMGELLTRDQHIYAEWRRHTECHLRQSAFAVQVKGNPGEDRKLKVQTNIKALNEAGPIPVEELNTAIRRLLAAHGGDELAVARAIAKQIKGPAAQLAAAWDDFP